MRALLVTAMLFLTFATPGKAGSTQSQTTSPKPQGKEATRETPQKSPVIQEGTTTPTLQLRTQREQNTPQPEPKPWLTHGELVMATLTAIYVLLTGGYVLIASLTLKAINRQGHLNEKQAESNAQQLERQLKAVEGQLKVMEGQLALVARQWVDLKGWTAVQKKGQNGTAELTVGFDIVNPTRLPLILELIQTKIKDVALPFIFEQHISLMPAGYHRLWINFDLTEEMKAEFRATNGLTLGMQITVWFRDQLKRAEEQHFSGMLLYTNLEGKESADFLLRGDMIPRPSGPNDADKVANQD
jgi:hypothetical protein